MTKIQSDALDLFTELVVCEADRIKMINENGIEPDNYDTNEIDKRKLKAADCSGVFDGMGTSLMIDIINKSLEINNFKFDDKRNYNRLYDVIADDMQYFK